ncbi:MAG: hypothetical protein QOJ29_2642 [Thermoleophilaceae bacterium]|jgi:hypothetical protein|nr:hypothetical protein [Thermoleophilaceae bacterium]
MDPKPPRLKTDEPLPMDAVVVRAGISPLDAMRDSAYRHSEDRLDRGLDEEYALSVEYRLGCTAAEIAIRATVPHIHRYRQMRQTTVQRLTDLGFSVVHQGRPGHGKIKLGGEPTDAILTRVDQAFDAPEDNPGYEGTQ